MPTRPQLTIRMADARDREVIYRMRHDVFAAELHQHATNATGRLTDALDAFNHYIVATEGERMVGFISITPPGGSGYSIDKYFQRTELPFPVDDRLYEIRLLSVPRSNRSRLLAAGLMYAAFRWIEARGGTRVVAIGRAEIRKLHLRVGMQATGQNVQAGQVTYGLLHATLAQFHAAFPGIRSILNRVQAETAWQIGVDFDTPAPQVRNADGNLEEEINKIFGAWNPLLVPDFLALDEYRGYVARIRLTGGDANKIRTYLKKLVGEELGLGYDEANPDHREDIERVVEDLVHLFKR